MYGCIGGVNDYVDECVDLYVASRLKMDSILDLQVDGRIGR